MGLLFRVWVELQQDWQVKNIDMARQLDFSPLDRRQQILQSSAYRTNVASKSIDEVFGAAKQYVDTNNQRRQELLKATNIDEDLTTDAIVNDRYQKLFEETVRNPLISKLSEKGRLGYISPQDVNEAQTLQKQFERELGLAKSAVDARNKAVNVMNDPKNYGVYEMDDEKWNGFMDIMTGKYDENPSKYVRDLFRNGEVNESPFLKIRPADMEVVSNAILKDALKSMPTDEVVVKNEADRRGVTVTNITRQELLDQGKKRMLGDVMAQMAMSGKYGDPRTLAKGSQKMINQVMPTSVDPIAAISFVLDSRVDGFFNNQKQAVISTKTTKETKPDSESRSGKKVSVIEPTEVGYKFGENPVNISGKLTYIEDDGSEKTETFKNAYVVGVDPNNKTASVIVPKGGFDFSKLEPLNKKMKTIEDSYEDDGYKTDPEYVALNNEFFDMLSDKNKYDTKEVKLEGIYDELGRGLKKKKIVLRGYENIDFSKNINRNSSFSGVPKGGF